MHLTKKASSAMHLCRCTLNHVCRSGCRTAPPGMNSEHQLLKTYISEKNLKSHTLMSRLNKNLHIQDHLRETLRNVLS